jgi:hypothetical protein
MGSKNARRAKNNYFLFLVYFRYFSGFILSRLGFFELNQIKGWADSLGPPVSQPYGACAPPPPYGACAPPRRALPPDHGDLSSSPPIVAIAAELRPVDLALAA